MPELFWKKTNADMVGQHSSHKKEMIIPSLPKYCTVK